MMTANRALSDGEISRILTDFLDEFWMAPGDVFLRMHEVLVWRGIQPKRPVLDIGCGDGSISKYIFSHMAPIAMGVDLHPGEALKTGVYADVQEEDATDLSFKDESFTTVISNSTFEHIAEDEQAVHEAARVLKPGGTFWVTVPTPVLKRVLKELTVSEQVFNGMNDRVAHYHYRSKKEWERVFAEAGLGLVEQRAYFGEEKIREWYRWFRLATWKPYKRELWSYMTDERFRRFVSVNLVKRYEKLRVLPLLQQPLWEKGGGWQVIQGIKQ